MNSILDKTNLDSKFAYVNLPNDFEITNESQIIFAPNGSGKTTLFNILINQNKGKCEVYTYDSINEPTYKIIDGKKKKIEINSMPTNYFVEKSKLDVEQTNLSSKDVLSVLYGTYDKTKIKSISNEDCIIEASKSGIINKYAPLDDIEREKLKYILPYKDDLEKVLRNRDKLISLSEEQKNNDIEVIKMLDKKVLFNSYDFDKHKDEIIENGCPLCGRKDDNVYNDILAKKKEVYDAKFECFENFEFLKKLGKEISINEVIDTIIDGISKLTTEKILFLLLTSGNKEKEEQLKVSIENYKDAYSKVEKYTKDRDELYNKMVVSKEIIINNFPKFYPNSTVKFDDSKKIITISTPRNMDTYSEGEKHEMYSTIKELSIIGSDKEIVIADEPLTDLDVANEYRNVFRFVKLAHIHNKKVIIFTCNPNFINIANEYHSKIFKRYYLSSYLNENSSTLMLDLLQMDFTDNNGKGAYLSLQKAESNDNSKLNNLVTKLVNKRAQLEITKNECNNDREVFKKISQVFHYDCFNEYSIDSTTSINNDDLYKLIEDFKSLPKYTSFSELARDRICYLAAMRVYIEKKLYDYQQDRIAYGFKDCFLNDKVYLTKTKIEVVDKIRDGFKITDKYKNWNKSELMCLKTMLNDNDHPYSQILPLTFAISIGNDALTNEIINLKKIFDID